MIVSSGNTTSFDFLGAGAVMTWGGNWRSAIKDIYHASTAPTPGRWISRGWTAVADRLAGDPNHGSGAVVNIHVAGASALPEPSTIVAVSDTT